MTAILSALGSGVSANKILEFLMRKSPELAPKITKALASGLTAEKVLKFFSKHKNFEKIKSTMEKAYPMENNANPLVQAQKVRSQNLGNDPTSSLQRNTGPVLGAAAGMGTSMALSRAIPAILQRGAGALGAANPQSMQKMPQIGMQGTQPTSQPPMGPGPNSPGVQVMPNAPINQPQATQTPNISQPAQSLQPINAQRDIKKSVDIIKSTGHEATVKNLIEGGLSPTDIKDTLGQIMGKKKLKELETATGGIEQAIQDYASSMPQQQAETPQEMPQDLSQPESRIEQKQPNHIRKPASMDEVKRLHDLWEKSGKKLPFERVLFANLQIDEDLAKQLAKSYEGISQQLTNPEMQTELQPNDENIPEAKEMIEEPTEEAKPIQKHETVSTPHGIGEVKSIKEKSALVEIDGKLHKVGIEELERPLFTDDDVADAYDDLMAKIPEEHRSGFISWAGYDEDKNEIGFIPRGGKYEVLTNITPEEAKKIKEGKGIARTTGTNREGLWVQGEDTRGGVISQIIHDRRKSNKKEEDKQLKLDFNLPKREKEDRGMKPIFDEMAHARGLSQERDKKKALEAREKKKREKERLKREENEAKKRKR